jgi:DinB superfamily
MSDAATTARDPRYPVGKFHAPESISPENRARYLEIIAAAPARLRAAVAGLSAAQLDTPYREGGWTVRQVVHHIPDSHMNAYFRFKLALTENNPVIKPYDEAACALLGDYFDTPVETSLTLLESLHERWVILMRSLSAEDWRKQFVHPEYGRGLSLEYTLALYAWHSEHHIAHVKQALEKRD